MSARMRREREAPDMAAMVGRVARSMVRRAEDGELEVLSALKDMREAIEAAYIEAGQALHEWNDGAYSYALIASELGITRQAAFQAFSRKERVDAPEITEPLFEVAG